MPGHSKLSKREVERQLARLREEKTAWEEERRMLQGERNGWSQEKRSLEESAAGLEREMEELIKVKNGLEFELQKLQERDKQNTTALKRNIELASRHAPPLRLPLEILWTIAGFVAGSNNFGTLLTLCQASKLLHQECRSTLYETVVWNQRLMDQYNGINDIGPFPDSWKHIKFMFVDYDHMRHMYEDDVKRNAAFPQITTFIRKKFYFPFRGHSEAREYSAELWIRKPTTVALLSAILRYPIAWTFGGQEQFLHPVDNIYWIEVASAGSLVRGDCNPGDLFRSKSPAYRVSIGADAADVPTETQRATIRELERFFLPVDSSPLVVRKHRVTIGTNFSLMGLWLEQLPRWLEMEPGFCPTFTISDDDHVTSEAFVKVFLEFAQLFESRWHDIYQQWHHDPKDDRNPVLSFDFSTSDYTRFNAYVSNWRYHAGGMHVYVEEYASNDDFDPVMVFDEVYIPRLRRRIPIDEARQLFPDPAFGNR